MRIHEYTLKEVAAITSLHYSTISVITKRARQNTKYKDLNPKPFPQTASSARECQPFGLVGATTIPENANPLGWSLGFPILRFQLTFR